MSATMYRDGDKIQNHCKTMMDKAEKKTLFRKKSN